MVFDVDKLKEALADLEDVKVALEVSGEWDENDTDAVALEVLRLVAAGQPLWWCERHQQAVWIAGGKSCYAYAVGNETTRCVMVEGWWMPTGASE